MIKLEFIEEDKRLLSYGRFNHPHPRVQLKMEVLWLKSQGLSHQKIAKLANHQPIIYRWRVFLIFFVLAFWYGMWDLTLERERLLGFFGATTCQYYLLS